MKFPSILSISAACHGLIGSFSVSEAAVILAPADYGSFRDQGGTFGTIGAGDGFFDGFLSSNYFPSIGTIGIQDRALVEFNMATLPNSVDSAHLALVLTRNNGSMTIPLGYQIFAYSGNGTVSFADSGDFSSGVLAGAFNITNQPVGEVILIDVTDALNNLIGSGAGFAGFRIQFAGSEPPLDRFTWLSGFSNGSNVPSLVVALPEPSLFMTCAMGGALLGWRRRRFVQAAEK